MAFVRTLAIALLLFVGAGCSTSPYSNDAALGARASRPSSFPRHKTPRIRSVDSTTTPWVFAPAPELRVQGTRIETDHFTIYTTIDQQRTLDRLPLFYERALAFYTSAFGSLPMPRKMMDTYMFKDRRQWEAQTKILLPQQAGAYATLGRGGLTARGTAILYHIDGLGGDRDTLAIAAHEGWHQYTQTTFKQMLPIWLEEGIATYMEGYLPDSRDRSRSSVVFVPHANDERLEALKTAVRRQRLIAMPELLGQTPQAFLETSKSNLLSYYAQVWALIRFLVESNDGIYAPALDQVVADAAHGRMMTRLHRSPVIALDRRRAEASTTRLGTAVVLEYFNSDMKEFEEQYLAFIRELVYGPRSGSVASTSTSTE